MAPSNQPSTNVSVRMRATLMPVVVAPSVSIEAAVMASPRVVRRKNSRSKRGHRQEFTLVRITDLGRSTVEDATTTLNAKVFADIGMTGEESRALVSSIDTLRRHAGDF